MLGHYPKVGQRKKRSFYCQGQAIFHGIDGFLKINADYQSFDIIIIGVANPTHYVFSQIK